MPTSKKAYDNLFDESKSTVAESEPLEKKVEEAPTKGENEEQKVYSLGIPRYITIKAMKYNG